jgi:23S rRNA pseudouridine1911/1915/1917 synthase
MAKILSMCRSCTALSRIAYSTVSFEWVSEMSMAQQWEAVVGASETGMRLDQFWTRQLTGQEVSRGEIQEWVRSGKATVNGAFCTKPGQKVAYGQVLGLAGARKETVPEPVAGRLAIRHADQDLVVLEKPAGLVVHPAPSVEGTTLVHLLLHHYPQLSGLDSFRPGIVHRLDKDTSGLLVIAMSRGIRDALSRDFSQRRITKEYLALVHGRPDPPEGEIKLPMGRHPQHKTRMAVLRTGGRDAYTRYATVWTSHDGAYSMLKVGILTGRTHQIRVHLAHMGHPIVGDALYGGAVRGDGRRSRTLAKLANRQMLHAYRLGLTHPGTGERMEMSSAPPKDFMRTLRFLHKHCQRVGITGMPGSGKSTLLSILGRRRYPVWSADEAVSLLYQPGADGWVMLRKRFGERFTPDQRKPVDRGALLAAMAEDARVVREVEALIHPLVEHELARFFHESRDAAAAFAEVPLLAEKGWARGGLFDVTVCLFMDEERRRRVLEAKGWTEAMIGLVESRQWTQGAKMRACDLALDNSGGPELLEDRARSLLKELRSIRTGSCRRSMARLESLWLGTELTRTVPSP